METRYSRVQFLRRGAVAAVGVAGLGLLDSATAFGRAAGDPSPIPGGLKFTATGFDLVPSDPDLHLLLPGIGFEMSTITDFKGVVGGSEIRGTATGSDGSSWEFDTDMRFMQGTYVDTGGRVRTGSFGFV